MVVTEAFEPIARATIESAGTSGHPLVVLPASTEFAKTDELRMYAQRVVSEVFDA